VTAQDWSSCADDLDRLRRGARNASDAAEQAKYAAEQAEYAREELENCLMFPDVYDLLEDGCQSYRWDYESARSDYESAYSEYESARSNVESELDTVGRRIRNVNGSCY